MTEHCLNRHYYLNVNVILRYKNFKGNALSILKNLEIKEATMCNEFLTSN